MSSKPSVVFQGYRCLHQQPSSILGVAFRCLSAESVMNKRAQQIFRKETH